MRMLYYVKCLIATVVVLIVLRLCYDLSWYVFQYIRMRIFDLKVRHMESKMKRLKTKAIKLEDEFGDSLRELFQLKLQGKWDDKLEAKSRVIGEKMEAAQKEETEYREYIKQQFTILIKDYKSKLVDLDKMYRDGEITKEELNKIRNFEHKED